MSRHLAIVLAVLLLADAQSRAQDAPVLVDPPAETATNVSPEDAGEAEAAKARSLIVERLRALSQPAEKGKPRDKATESRMTALREVLKTRERLILDWEKTRKARQGILNIDPTPESEATELRRSLERLKVSLAKAKADSSTLLPENLRNQASATSEAFMSELKDAIGDAEEEAENLSKELESLNPAAGRKNINPVSAAKAERDEVRKKIAALGPRAAEVDAALSSATSSETREIAREQIVNLDWETKVEAERLKELEARIDLETRRSAVAGVKGQVIQRKLELSKMTVDLLKNRYAARLERQRTEAKNASAAEAVRAEHTNDPLEKYRARRNKEVLDQIALLREREQEKEKPAIVSLEEQTARANNAEKDFDKLKKLVEGGRSSALVAQRLNNSFRRLSSERAAINRVELGQVIGLLARYENELTAIELDLLNDERGDRALRDNLLASLPNRQKDEALQIFAKTEKDYRDALENRKDVVVYLEERTEKTRQEVLRRLRILDDQHAYVRTHLFWVRDSQPLGIGAIDLIKLECLDLGRTLFGIATEPWSRSHWERISSEFILASAGLICLPYVLYRTRKALRTRLAIVPELRMAPLTTA